MRELDSGHALDRDDSGVDAPCGQPGGAPRPRYEAVHDAVTRRANALAYRQRVDAEYAACNAGQDAQVSHLPAESATRLAGGNPLPAFDCRLRRTTI